MTRTGRTRAASELAGRRTGFPLSEKSHTPSSSKAGLPAVARRTSEGWSQLSDLNRRPTVYKTVALPLS